MDILEMDAASKLVLMMLELMKIQSIVQRVKFKIFIIDEVHAFKTSF